MQRIITAALAAMVVATASPAFAGKPRPPAPPSSYAPNPTSGPHVYGAPIGAPTVGRGSNAQRKHASAKRSAKTTTHHARAAKPTPKPAPVYAEPVAN